VRQRRDTSAVGSRGLPSAVGADAPTVLERHGVTPRELEVLEALGERLSNSEIAGRLYVSVRTVESHVASLMRKLGTTRRRELTRIWSESRPLIEQPRTRLPPVLELLADPVTFIGRVEEQTRLRDMWGRAKRGQLLVAVIVGEAGIGKSRLTAELSLEVQQDGGGVQLGSCFQDLGIPYEPFVQIVASDAHGLSESELAERARGGARALARLVPELGSRLGIAEPSSLADGQFERAAIFSALHSYLCAMARGVPQLVVIEDFQWSTVTTRDGLRHLCRTGAAVPMLMVVTSRDTPPDLDDALAALLSDLNRLPPVTVIALPGLSGDEVAGLLAETTTSISAAEVHAATDGNPLLTLELAQAGRGPGPVTGLLAGRYDRLARTELDVLDVCVVVGSKFDAQLVAAAADRTVEEVVKALEAAERAGLVSALPGQPGWFTFVHSLFRTLRYDALPTSSRLRLHRSVAAVLAPRVCVDGVLHVLAHHACAAVPIGDADEAMGFARRAGDAARRKFALDEAADHYRQALAMLDLTRLPDPRIRLHLEIDLADAEVNAGQAGGRSRLLAAADEARRQADHDALVRATLALTALDAPLAVAGRGDPEIVDAISEALANVPPAPPRVRALLLAGLGYELIFDDVLRARNLAREAIGVARQLDELSTLGAVLLTYRFLIYEPALAAERDAVCNELIELGQKLDDPTLTIAGLVHQLTLRREAGDLRSHGETRTRLIDYSELHPSPSAQISVIAIEAADRYLAGDLSGAEATIQQLATVTEQTVFHSLDTVAPHVHVIRYQQGRIVELLPRIEQLGAKPRFPVYRAALIMALARAGRLSAAAVTLKTLAASDYDLPHNAHWFVGTEMLADGVEILGNTVAAAVLLDRLAPFTGRLADFIHGVSRPADQALAQLMLTLGDFNGASAMASRAIEASRQRGTPIFLGRELVLLAEARHRAGQPNDQLQPLVDEAHRIANATGARLIDQEIARYGLPEPTR
jgi:DNA-binding CsgD family transcriptional regulator